VFNGIRVGLLSLVLALSAACISLTDLEPHVIGIGDLDKTPTGDLKYPSAGDLATFDDGCSETDLEWCGAGRTVPEYVLGGRDRITVSVWGRDDLGSPQTTEASQRVSMVQANGTIFLPFLGDVDVEGQTVHQVRQMLTELYEPIQETPQINIDIVSCGSRRVQIEGEVESPGGVHLCFDNLTLGSVLARAGGLTDRADASRGILVRRQVPLDLEYSSALRGESDLSELLLEGGDRIYFPSISEESYYVFGETRAQGFFAIPREGITVLGALAGVGGYDPSTAGSHRIFLVRLYGMENPVIHQLDFEDLLGGPEINLVAGDRLFIPPTKLATWGRWWRQIFPFSVGNRVITTVQ
jgi:polysaccharide export outer membrane protein